MVSGFDAVAASELPFMTTELDKSE